MLFSVGNQTASQAVSEQSHSNTTDIFGIERSYHILTDVVVSMKLDINATDISVSEQSDSNTTDVVIGGKLDSTA